MENKDYYVVYQTCDCEMEVHLSEVSFEDAVEYVGKYKGEDFMILERIV